MKRQIRANPKRASRGKHAAMAAVAACAVMVATGAAADASRVSQFIAGTKAVIEAADAATLRPKMLSQSRPFAPEIMAAHMRARRLNANRALDWRLRELYHAHLVSAKNIADLRRCISAADLAREIRSWREAAQCRLREIDDVILFFARNGHPTLEAEMLWEDYFRSRIRREGALARILDGKIISSPRRERVATTT